MNRISSSRRGFLKAAAAAPAVECAAMAGAAPRLPVVRFGKHEVTRLIVGTNPLWGYSHFNHILNQAMREYMTEERRMETVLACERQGINTWQYHVTEETVADYRRMKERGGQLQCFMLGHGPMLTELPLVAKYAKVGPIGIAHHGNVTDDRFREKKMGVVRDFTKAVRDAGVMVGVSMHNPEVLDYIESAGWDVDYYMCCFYRVSRTREEIREACGGEEPLGEAFFAKDPERMTRAIRSTGKPVLAFKVLAAGRVGHDRAQIEAAFRYAYANIKPSDAVIVGMWPKYKDEPAENAAVVRAILKPAT